MVGGVAVKLEESTVPIESLPMEGVDGNSTRVEVVKSTITSNSRMKGVRSSSTTTSNGCWRFTAAPPPAPTTFPRVVDTRYRAGK